MVEEIQIWVKTNQVSTASRRLRLKRPPKLPPNVRNLGIREGPSQTPSDYFSGKFPSLADTCGTPMLEHVQIRAACPGRGVDNQRHFSLRSGEFGPWAAISGVGRHHNDCQ